MKKEWEKPAITVITKSTSEESVLLSCKNSEEVGGLGPAGMAFGCWIDINPPYSVCRLDNIS